MLTSSAGPLLWVGSERIARAGYLVHFANDWLVLGLYLPAVASAIDSIHPCCAPFDVGPSPCPSSSESAVPSPSWSVPTPSS